MEKHKILLVKILIQKKERKQKINRAINKKIGKNS